jgi:hypothetical protein
MISTPKLLIWIAFVGLMIYVFFFGFNRLQENLNSEFGGVEQSFQSNIEYFGRETHLDQLLSYVKSEFDSITGSKSKQDATSSTTESEAGHKRHREHQSDSQDTQDTH